MKIHPVKRDKNDKNRYCGPAAISIVTGMNTGEAARLLRHVSGARKIIGVFDWQMHRAYAQCGIRMSEIPVTAAPAKEVPVVRSGEWIAATRASEVKKRIETRPTMTQWLKDSTKIRAPGRVFLVSAGNHWQIVSGRRFCCGRTGEIISITDKRANRRARVDGVFELTIAAKNGRISIPMAARKPKAHTEPAKKALKALERKHGFKGKIENDGGFKDYIIPACALFPEGLYTMHHDWATTLERIKAAIEDPSLIVDGNISF